jgi:hypothetical protein
MMTPKEKARDLIQKFNLIVLDTALGGSNTRVKKCALICVDEIISVMLGYEIIYWQKVKEEIQKL